MRILKDRLIQLTGGLLIFLFLPTQAAADITPGPSRPRPPGVSTPQPQPLRKPLPAPVDDSQPSGIGPDPQASCGREARGVTLGFGPALLLATLAGMLVARRRAWA